MKPNAASVLLAVAVWSMCILVVLAGSGQSTSGAHHREHVETDRSASPSLSQSLAGEDRDGQHSDATARQSKSATVVLDPQEMASWDHDKIKCRVCIAAIDDMWYEGTALQARCKKQFDAALAQFGKPEPGETLPYQDPHGNCDHDDITHTGIRRYMQRTCPELPERHDSTHRHPKGGFRLTRVEHRHQGDSRSTAKAPAAVFTSIPLHPDVGRDAIIRSCREILSHSSRNIVDYFYTQLNYNTGNKRQTLRALRETFCFDFCTRGTRKRGTREPKFKYDEDL